MKLSNEDYVVEIKAKSKDCEDISKSQHFDHVFVIEDSDYFASFAIDIHDLVRGKIFNIAIICGWCMPSKHIAILEESVLLLLTQATLAAIDLKTMTLLRQREVVSLGTAFGLYPFGENYLVHGELDIVMLDRQLEKLWSFSARDIFALPSGEEAFEIIGERIVVRDWMAYQYTLDQGGNLISEEYIGDKSVL